MRVALCFSGAIRTFKTCFPSINRYLIQTLQPDIFVYGLNYDVNNDLQVNFKIIENECSPDYVISKLSPKKYKFESFTKDLEKEKLEKAGFTGNEFLDEKQKNYGFNAIGMYHSIMTCFELMEEYSRDNNIKYDLIIRARMDFIYEDFIYPHFFEKINNTLFLVRDRYATHSKLETNDKFFAGDFEIMKKMCNVFSEIKNYYQQNIFIEGQTIMEKFIKNNSINVKWIGHKDTYYKCMNRHKRHIKTINIMIDKLDEFVLFNLGFELLENGYNIYTNNKINNYINVLTSFENFKMEKNDLINFEIKFENNEIEIKNCQNNKVSKLILNKNIKIYGPNNDEIICYDKNNIYIDDVVDFIISIIEYDDYQNFYVDKSELTININLNEKIIFKYLDRGYYFSEIINHNNNIYQINDKLTNNLKRNNFKILNMCKYFEDNILPSNKSDDYKKNKIELWNIYKTKTSF